MTELTATSRLQRNPELSFTILDAEVVILDAENEIFFNSNDVGAVIWNALENPIALEAICDIVESQFEGAARTTIEADTLALLRTMLTKGLIQEVD